MKSLMLAVALLCMLTGPAHATFWKYNDERRGQDDWGNLDPAFALCKNGIKQSPVSINRTQARKLPPLVFNYSTASTSFFNDRYTNVGTPGGRLTLKEGTQEYVLKEMMWRTPGEHEIRGEYPFLELQLLHENAAGKKLLLSVFLVNGTFNSAVQAAYENYPGDRKSRPKANVEYQKLLPRKLGYYAYDGSLSYPPCTEGVQIRVLKEPIEASREQMEKLIRKIGRNARNPQPVYNRTIFESLD